MLIIAVLRTVAYILIGIRMIAFAVEQYDKQKEIDRLEVIRDQLEAAYQEQKMFKRLA